MLLPQQNYLEDLNIMSVNIWRNKGDSCNPVNTIRSGNRGMRAWGEHSSNKLWAFFGGHGALHEIDHEERTLCRNNTGNSNWPKIKTCLAWCNFRQWEKKKCASISWVWKRLFSTVYIKSCSFLVAGNRSGHAKQLFKVSVFHATTEEMDSSSVTAGELWGTWIRNCKVFVLLVSVPFSPWNSFNWSTSPSLFKDYHGPHDIVKSANEMEHRSLDNTKRWKPALVSSF